jgi:hypothetical protein
MKDKKQPALRIKSRVRLSKAALKRKTADGMVKMDDA